MMKIKRKGKIHPSPPPPPPATLPNTAPSTSQDSLSVLNLLPAAILALAAVLSLQDREVLAYMITRSLKTTTACSINSFYRNNKQMKTIGGSGVGSNHKAPVFDCDCFDCYTLFWFRWDSSPNRELIHQAIEAFEEHLANGEVQTKRSGNRRSRKKEKLPRQNLENKIQITNPVLQIEASQLPVDVTSPEVVDSEVAEKENEVNLTPVEAAEVAAVVVETAASGHKGFARKVLSDVLGVFNLHLWNLWGPNA